MDSVSTASALYRESWFETISIDDRLWHQAMVTHRFQRESRRWAVYRSKDAKALWELIQEGIKDVPEQDNLGVASTRSLRFTTAVADRLWAIVEEEQTRVCGC